MLSQTFHPRDWQHEATLNRCADYIGAHFTSAGAVVQTQPVPAQGRQYSDHLNYWPLGLDALMITDTAFYRNKAYHQQGDTADSLDYERMAKVVIAVFEATKSI